MILRNAREWDKIFRSENSYSGRSPDHSVQTFATLLARRRIKTVCDIGCGAGRHSIYFAEMGFSVIAVDSSSSALKRLETTLKASESLNQRITPVKADLRNLKGQFDAILCWHVLGHGTAHDILEDISYLVSLLGKKGVALINTPSINDPRIGNKRGTAEIIQFRPKADWERKISHTGFSKEMLRSIIEQAGAVVHKEWEEISADMKSAHVAALLGP